MAGEELQVVSLRDDFYRDGFYKVLLALGTLSAAIFLLAAVSFYLYAAKPAPITFSVDKELRILPPVPVDQPYLSTADLIQWVSVTVPSLFNFSFVSYDKQLKSRQQFFTEEGWKKFTDQINLVASANMVQNGKLFVNGSPSGAPFILNQGLLQNRYAWWVQIPIKVEYNTYERNEVENLNVQVLVVRVPTTNNLDGVAIDNIIVAKGKGIQVRR